MQQPYQPFASENMIHTFAVIFAVCSSALFLELFRRLSGLSDRSTRAESLLRKINQSREETTVRSEELERRTMIISQTISSKIEKLEQMNNCNAARIEHLNQFARQSKTNLTEEMRNSNSVFRAELDNLSESTKHELETVSDCIIEFRAFLKNYIEFEIHERKRLSENTCNTFLDVYNKLHQSNDPNVPIDQYYAQINDLQQLFCPK